MELNYLRAFYEVAKAGKFSAAAQTLRISQSALSRSVALLEENQKVLLFDRSKKGVVLTEKGKQVFHHCERLFQMERDIEDVCRGTQDKCEGPLRFAATDHVINYFLVNPIHAFRRKYPAVIPSIRSGTPDEIVDTLLKEECEFALLFSKVNSPQIEYRKLKKEPMALVCQPEIWQRHKSIKRILENHGYLCSIGALLERRPSRVLLELFGEAPKIGLETNSQEAQKRFCLAGEGIAYLSRFMVEEEISKGKLFEIPVDHQHEFDLWLAKRRGSAMSLNARRFLEHLGYID